MRVLLGLLPLPLRSGLRRLRGAAAARCCGCFGGCCAAAAPSCAAPSRGRGFPAWVRSRLRRGFLGADYAPAAVSCLQAAPCSPAYRGRKTAPAAVSVAACRCALLLSGRTPSCACPARCCPARCRVQPRCDLDTTKLHTRHAAPLPNCTKPAPKSIKKRQKARFLCGISPQAAWSASTDSTLKSPVSGAFWAAVDAAQSQKRYLKPSTWWGAAPFRAGGKAQLPRSQSCCRANDTLRRVNDSAPVRAAPGVAAALSDTARSARL